MFGGNATERRTRKERIWGALAFFVFSAMFVWAMSGDERTESSHMLVFWLCAVIAAPFAAYLVWRMADKEAPKSANALWLAFLGVGLNNLLDHMRFVIGTIFGIGAGFCAGAALGLLALVLWRPLSDRSPAREKQGDIPGS